MTLWNNERLALLHGKLNFPILSFSLGKDYSLKMLMLEVLGKSFFIYVCEVVRLKPRREMF